MAGFGKKNNVANQNNNLKQANIFRKHLTKKPAHVNPVQWTIYSIVHGRFSQGFTNLCAVKKNDNSVSLPDNIVAYTFKEINSGAPSFVSADDPAYRQVFDPLDKTFKLPNFRIQFDKMKIGARSNSPYFILYGTPTANGLVYSIGFSRNKYIDAKNKIESSSDQNTMVIVIEAKNSTENKSAQVSKILKLSRAKNVACICQNTTIVNMSGKEISKDYFGINIPLDVFLNFIDMIELPSATNENEMLLGLSDGDL